MRKCNQMNYTILSSVISDILNQSAKKYLSDSIKHLSEDEVLNFSTMPMLKILSLLNGENFQNNLNYYDWERVLISQILYLSSLETDMTEIFYKTEDFIMKNFLTFNNLYPFPKTYYGNSCQIALQKNGKNHEVLKNVQSLISYDYNLVKFYSTFDSNCLGYLTRTSTYSDDLIDHHLQYVIITILLNTISETYNSSIDGIVIEKLKTHQLKLFHIVLEELLSYGLWEIAVRFINIHSLPERIGNGLIKLIVGRELYGFEKEDEYVNFMSRLTILNDKYNTDILNQISDSKGYYFEYRNMYKEAMENYLESGCYQKAHNVLCNRLLPMSIINRNNNNYLKQKLITLSKHSININNWISVGNIFLLYFKYNEANYNKGSKEKIQIEQLEDLLKKISALPENDVVMISCKNVMLLDIREKVNKCLENDSNEEVRLD